MTKRIGIIGCGKIANRHLDVISRLDSAKAVGLTDIIRDAADKKGKPRGIPVFPDAETLINESQPDILVILTPSGEHRRNVEALAKYRLPLVVEKPIALSIEDGNAMIEICRDFETRLYVVKQNRFNRPVQRLRRALEENRFGKLVMGTVRIRWTRDQDYYDAAAWRGTWKLDGGVLANQAAHHIDLLLWMMGPVSSVSAMSFTHLVNIEADDTAIAILRFRSGAAGIIEATTAARPRDLEGAITVMGEKGSVEVAGFAMNELRSWNFAENMPDDETVFETDGGNPGEIQGYGHFQFYKTILRDLDNGGSNSSPGIVGGEEALKTVKLIDAIYQSVSLKKEVTVA